MFPKLWIICCSVRFLVVLFWQLIRFPKKIAFILWKFWRQWPYFYPSIFQTHVMPFSHNIDGNKTSTWLHYVLWWENEMKRNKKHSWLVCKINSILCFRLNDRHHFNHIQLRNALFAQSFNICWGSGIHLVTLIKTSDCFWFAPIFEQKSAMKIFQRSQSTFNKIQFHILLAHICFQEKFMNRMVATICGYLNFRLQQIGDHMFFDFEINFNAHFCISCGWKFNWNRFKLKMAITKNLWIEKYKKLLQTNKNS